MVQDSQVGRRILPGSPPPPTSKYYRQHRFGVARPQAPGRLVGQNQGRPTRHWFESVRRRATSEGSMLLTVTGSLNTERRQRGGKGRGEHDRTGQGGGGLFGTFARRESKGD